MSFEESAAATEKQRYSDPFRILTPQTPKASGGMALRSTFLFLVRSSALRWTAARSRLSRPALEEERVMFGEMAPTYTSAILRATPPRSIVIRLRPGIKQSSQRFRLSYRESGGTAKTFL